MARFKYDSDKVSNALSELELAKKTLDNVNTEINAGITTIMNARGSKFISVDFNSILGLKETSIEYIDTIIKDIEENKRTIEEYNSAPWYKKVFATTGMAITKFGEGIATGGEQLVDGFASLTGMVVGVFNNDAKEAIGEFVKKDHVGDAFAASYNHGILANLEKYSAFSSTSTAANVFKGIGVATAYVAVAAATGGAGAAMSGGTLAVGAVNGVASIGVNAAIAGIGGLGAGTQSGLQEGKSYNRAFAKGIKTSAISAGTVLVAGKIGQKFTKTSALDPALTEGSAKALPSGNSTAALTSGNLTDDASRLIEGATTTAKNGIKYSAGTIDDLTRLSSSNSTETKAIIDAAKAAGAKGYSLSSDGVMNFYDASGKVLKSGNLFNSAVNTATSSTDDIASVATNVIDDFGDNVIKVNSGKVLNTDGSTAAYYAGKEATLGEKAAANIKNAGLNVKDVASNISSKASNTAATISEKVAPVATTSKEVFKSVANEFVTNPVTEGIVVAQNINGIRNSSSNSVENAKANYIFNSDGTIKEKNESVEILSEETSDKDTPSENKTSSQNIFSNSNIASSNESNATSNVNTSAKSEPDIVSNTTNSTETSIKTTNTVNNVEKTAEPIANSNNLENTNTENKAPANESSNNYNDITNKKYTTNNYDNTVNNYNNTTNNYNNTINDTSTVSTDSTSQMSTQSKNTASMSTNSGVNQQKIEVEPIKYESNNATNVETISKNITLGNSTSTTSKSNVSDNAIYSNANIKETTESLSNASTIKKVLGTVASVGAVASAAGLGYKAYKKYEDGDFLKKSKNVEEKEDEYNFVDGKWHDEDDTENVNNQSDSEVFQEEKLEEYE